MSTSFSRTLRALDADRFRGGLLVLAVCGLLLAAWLAWFFLADVALYEVTDDARLEVDREPHVVMSLVTGRVVDNRMVIGREVAEGDVLVELDADAKRFELEENWAEVKSAERQLDRLRTEIAEQKQALERAMEAEGSAVAEAEAHRDEALEAARFAEQEAKRISSLREQGLVSASESEAAETEARSKRKGAEALDESVVRLRDDLKLAQSEKRAELSALERRAAEIEGRLESLAAVGHRLARELSLHTLRAPVAGRVGDVVPLRVGEVVTASTRLGTVIPEGEVRVVAQFLPYRALGRIREGQRGKLRLKGFSWVQYGSVDATVARVASEPQNGRVRVEMSLDAPESFGVPLEHGLPGTLEVEVERIAPAALVLRAAGGFVSHPVGP